MLIIYYLSCISLHLSNRRQYVLLDGIKSHFQPVCGGVPYGLITGPLLFLMYINDIVNVSNIFFLILFADDTNVLSMTKILTNWKIFKYQ